MKGSFGAKRKTVLHLSARLQAVADLVPSCRMVYDIGTDHAFVPIYLIEVGRCRSAVAADLRSGPLRQADNHIRQRNLQDHIRTLRTDGLNGLLPQADDVVILAGLGGLEIQRILTAALPRTVLVIQAMKHVAELRHWLYRQGYHICCEQLVFDKHRFYPVVSAVWTDHPGALSELEAWVGPALLRDRPPQLPAYLARMHKRLLLQLRGNPQLQGVVDQLAALLTVPDHTDDA